MLLNLDRDFIVNSALDSLLEIEEQEERYHRFHPSELNTFQWADEVYQKLYQNQDWLLDFLNRNFGFIEQEEELFQKEIYLRLNENLHNMTLYYTVVRAYRKKVSQLKNPNAHESFYIETAKILLCNEKPSFSNEVLRFLKTCIDEKLSTNMDWITPAIRTSIVLFLASNDNEEENKLLLKRLEESRLVHKDLYLMYKVAYHQTRPEMDIVEYVPLHIFDIAKSDYEEQYLLEQLPIILTRRLCLDMSVTERYKLYMFLQHPSSNASAEIIEKYLDSTEPLVIESHMNIFRYFLNLIKQGENTEFKNLCSMMIFLYSCRDSKAELINALSLEEKDFIKNECQKYLARLRSLDTIAQTPEDFEYHIVCSFMAACFLRDTVSLWAAIKPLLLALRMSKKIWIPGNLKVMASYKKSEYTLASIIIQLFEMQEELAIEKELKKLRYDMADGLMDMLKPIPDKKYKPERVNNYLEAVQKREGFDPRCIEPDPLYRNAYINAFLELHIKTDDSGHTFFAELNRIVSNDLSTKVQSAAKDAIKKLNDDSQTMSVYSQRARIKTALWHIWQAHVLEHEASYDEDAALETKMSLSR